MINQKPLKTQIFDFVNEFKSVPTPMIFAFFGNTYTEGKIKYALSRLKNAGEIYQTEDNMRTSINRTYSMEPMNVHLLDALWVLVNKRSENVQVYAALKQKEYPKMIVFGIDNVLYEISVLDPMEETLYRSSIMRRIEDFHSDYTIDIAVVYDKINGEKALQELKFDAYCILEYPEKIGSSVVDESSEDAVQIDESNEESVQENYMNTCPTPVFYT